MIYWIKVLTMRSLKNLSLLHSGSKLFLSNSATVSTISTSETDSKTCFGSCKKKHFLWIFIHLTSAGIKFSLHQFMLAWMWHKPKANHYTPETVAAELLNAQ